MEAFSVEDWLMLAGWVLNIGHNTAAIVLAYSGLGSHDNIITVGMQYHIGLWTVIWQFIYVLDGPLIKSSIIWTLLRLAKNLNPWYRKILWALFALCWIVWQIAWPVAIFQCKPVAAAWGKPGDCTSGQRVILNVSYFVSAANIFTDLATTLVPVLMLRRLQMPSLVKLLTIGVLSLGGFASVATIIRITYTWAYTAPSERYYQIGKVLLLTVLECDLGIIAGSMPMLRRLFRSLASSYSASKGTPGHQSGDINLATIGGGGGISGGRRSNKHTLLSATNISRIGRNDRDGPSSHEYHQKDKDSNSNISNVNDDNESTRRRIHITREVEQENASSSEQDDHKNPSNQYHISVGRNAVRRNH